MPLVRRLPRRAPQTRFHHADEHSIPKTGPQCYLPLRVSPLGQEEL
jgi:hypothetical protein